MNGIWQNLMEYSSLSVRKFPQIWHIFTSRQSYSNSSKEWLMRHLRDPYVKMAQKQQYRARSAFKLIEIDNKYRFLKPGATVIDCGAAPGAWTQIATERVNADKKDGNENVGTVIAIDLLPIAPVDGAIVLDRCDFTDPKIQNKILDFLGEKKVDVILSDMAPNATGVQSLDHELIIKLCYSAFAFAYKVLKTDGLFLCKLWSGGETAKLKRDLNKVFLNVKFVKPEASRKESPEAFLLARGFKGRLNNSTS